VPQSAEATKASRPARTRAAKRRTRGAQRSPATRGKRRIRSVAAVVPVAAFAAAFMFGSQGHHPAAAAAHAKPAANVTEPQVTISRTAPLPKPAALKVHHHQVAHRHAPVVHHRAHVVHHHAHVVTHHHAAAPVTTTTPTTATTPVTTTTYTPPTTTFTPPPATTYTPPAPTYTPPAPPVAHSAPPAKPAGSGTVSGGG
jgi:hypothetical protein